MSATATKVRLVRCPKCRGILPELPNLQVYKCGGCGVTLRAKNRTQEGGHSELPVPNAVQNNQSRTLESPDTNPAQNHQLGSSGEPDTDPIQKSYGRSERPDINSIQNNTNPPQNYQGRCLETQDTKPVRNDTDPTQYNHVERLESPDANLMKRNQLGNAFAAKEPDSSLEEQFEQSQKIAHHYSNLASSRDTMEATDAIFMLEEDKLHNSHGDASNENIQSDIQSFSSDYQFEQSQKTVHQDSDHARLRDAMRTEERITEKDVICSRQGDFSSDKIPSDTARSSSTEQLDHARQRDWGDTTEAIDDSVISEEDKLCNRLRDVSKSPTNRSSYAYDGSISSSDGLDDQYFDRHSHLFRKTSFESQNVSQVAGANDYSADNKIDTDTDTDRDVRHQARRFSLLSFDGKQVPTKEQNEVKVDDCEGFGPVRSWMGLERGGGKSYQRGSPDFHEDRGPSNYRKREYCLHAHGKVESVESNELLKKVDELRDHLNRSYAPRGNENRQFPTTGNQQVHPWHEYQPHVQEVHCCDAKYLRQPSAAYRLSKSSPYECEGLRTSFSRQVPNCSHHAGYSCWHGYPERRQCSLQFQPPNTYHKGLGGVVGAHAVHMCNAPCSSSRSGPLQHRVDSNFHLRGYCTEPTFYDHGHTEHKMKLHHRERLNTIKRHYKPIAGGAPFVVCYRCSKLLHLPADFLQSKKRYHKLRCGSCSKVLLFSLSNSTILPYLTNPVVPPPSEVENSSDAATRRRLASGCHADDSSPGDDVSYSEDYGLSVPNSCFTEGDHTPASQNHIIHKNRVDKKEPNRSPPLHRLMGYSSASEIIQGPCMVRVVKSGLERDPPSMDNTKV